MKSLHADLVAKGVAIDSGPVARSSSLRERLSPVIFSAGARLCF
jgi:hypothetical protein